jgi:hypothetical protein
VHAQVESADRDQQDEQQRREDRDGAHPSSLLETGDEVRDGEVHDGRAHGMAGRKRAARGFSEPLEELRARAIEARLQHRIQDDATTGSDEEQERREAVLRGDQEQRRDQDDHHHDEARAQCRDLEQRPFDPIDAVRAHPAYDGLIERLRCSTSHVRSKLYEECRARDGEDSAPDEVDAERRVEAAGVAADGAERGVEHVAHEVEAAARVGAALWTPNGVGH